MTTPTAPTIRHRRWLRIIAGVALVMAPAIVLARTWDVLVTSNRWYLFTLLASIALGAWLVVSGLLATTRPRGIHDHTVQRLFGLLAALTFAGMLFWLMPLAASPAAMASLASDAKVTVTDTRASVVFDPVERARAGLVLYPGGKVDPRAYAVLARDIASKGYKVVVPKCPYNLALLCPHAADGYVTSQLPWAVGGHSLGGVIASDYAGNHSDVDGLVLWAAFPASSIADRKNLAVVSISGTNDALATPQKIADHADLLPAGTRYVAIKGGIHSYFGDYGLQPGDGIPTTTRANAQRQIVAATSDLLTGLTVRERAKSAS